jgi:hypothetical protein
VTLPLLDYSILDPGIAPTVRLLREAGFETTDSGDGESKPPSWFQTGEALPFPHVVVTSHPDTLIPDSEVVQWLLGPTWTVEATYTTHDGVAILFIRPRDTSR